MRVAWISYFPVEWLPDTPEQVRILPRQHPASWQRVLIEELVGMPGLDLHVLVVRKQFPNNFSFTWRGVQFHCLKVPGGARSLTLFWWETLQIRKALKQVRPDLLHAWGVERGAALVASRLPFKRLVTIQGLLRWYAQQVKPTSLQRFEAALEKPALRRARIITTESRFGVQWLSREYPHLEIIQAEHAPAWIFHKIERRPERGPVRFLYIGVLGPIKGTDILIKGLDELRAKLDFRLTIIGGGSTPYIAGLKAQSSPELWNRIELLNGLPPAHVADYMTRATIMLFPTRADTSPNSVKEAAVAGLPVLASRVGGIPDYVEHGKNGLLFEPNSQEDFVRAVSAAAAHPLFGLGKVDTVTHQRVREYLSPARMKELFLKAYEIASYQAAGY